MMYPRTYFGSIDDRITSLGPREVLVLEDASVRVEGARRFLGV